MSYFDPPFIFLAVPILIFIYNLLPKKARPIILLLFSFGFFIFISKWLVVFLVLSILTIYFTSNYLDKLNKKRNILVQEKPDNKKEIKEKYKKYKRRVLLLGILINISFLFFFKYLNFFATNTNLLLDLFDIDYSFKLTKFIAPIGISFYTLEALSYILDVYYEKIEADKNILRVSLYLSFFPQIMEGPIARYSDTAHDLYAGYKVTYDNFCFGYQRILYGFIKKLIIADRLNFLVNTVFDNYYAFNGATVALGVIGYTVMLYMEFSGTMDIVIGIGQFFGVKIPENFRQPFFAKNISEFWTRWHISLGLWFKDYIFYPVSLSKKMKKLAIKMRKVLGNRFGPLVSGAIALFSVWFLNGLWHGAGYTFLFYGMYQFTLILLGNIFEPTIKNICHKLHINRENIVYRIFQSIKMTFFVFIGELFFRATSLKAGFGMLKRIFTHFNLHNTLKSNELYTLGLDGKDYFIIIITLIGIFIVSLLKERHHNLRTEISKKNIIIRWIIYYILILSIIIFGAYGPGYIPVDPIYADF